MANINVRPSKYMYNLLHVLDPYTDDAKKVVNAIIEINSHTINKYELITESGQLKLDRVGYSTLSYPFAYGAIPKSVDVDGDALDIIVVNVKEPLIPGCLVEARILGVVKFIDDGEVDDKIIAVLNDDKRIEHIQKLEDLGEYFVKETTYFFEHYKDMKKPGLGKVEGIFGLDEAHKAIEECHARYLEEYQAELCKCECCDKCSQDGECCGNCDCL